MKAGRCHLVVAAVLAVSVSVWAGNTLTLFADVGYGFGMGGRWFEDSETELNGNTSEEKDHYINNGHGIKIGAGAAYRIMEQVDAALEVAFSGGLPSVKAIDETKTDNTAQTVTETWTYKHKRSQLGFKLSLAPRFMVADLIEMYVAGGMGVFFTFSSRDVTRDNQVLTKSSGAVTTSKYEAVVEYKNRPALAFIGAIGAEYPLTDMIILFGEVGYEAMNVTEKEYTVSETSFPTTGYPTYSLDREIYEQDAIDRQPPPKTPASNVSIRVGVKIPIL